MRHNAAMLAFALADAATVHEYAADSLYRHNVTAWTDAHIPRTDSPVRFSWHFDAHNGGKAKAWTEPYSWQV